MAWTGTRTSEGGNFREFFGNFWDVRGKFENEVLLTAKSATSPTVGLPPLKTSTVLSIEHFKAHQFKLTGVFTSFGMLNETENYDKNESYSNAN